MTSTPLLLTRRAPPIAIRLFGRSRPPALMPRRDDPPDVRQKERSRHCKGNADQLPLMPCVSVPVDRDDTVSRTWLRRTRRSLSAASSRCRAPDRDTSDFSDLNIVSMCALSFIRRGLFTLRWSPARSQQPPARIPRAARSVSLPSP
jgi:hypothetical protein